MTTFHVYADEKYLGKIQAKDSYCDEFYDQLRKVEVKDIQTDIYREKNGQLEWETSQFICSAVKD